MLLMLMHLFNNSSKHQTNDTSSGTFRPIDTGNIGGLQRLQATRIVINFSTSYGRKLRGLTYGLHFTRGLRFGRGFQRQYVGIAGRHTPTLSFDELEAAHRL
jgi:hypothetical protein